MKYLYNFAYGIQVRPTRLLGYETLFLDDSIPDHPLSSFTSYINPDTCFIPAFRLQWIERIHQAGGKLATLVHPTAYIFPTVVVECGCVILLHSIINTNVVVEKGCIVNLGAIVDHDCVIEEGVHLCVGAIVKGENRVERLSKIEAEEVVQAKQWPVDKK